jgi:BirA family transcriptional regulator, biotin operon repressor / biotin---[acetyl-CoA-carboxylase] ligase
MSDDLSAASIEASLSGRFGRPLRYLDVTDSTNEQALGWLTEGAPEGALVVADRQTAGRGRRGRIWQAQAGEALLFSLVLRPSGRSTVLELLTTTLGVACADAIEAACGLPVTLKWPNDVTIEGRKLAGILVESRLRGGVVEGVVAGVGINVRLGHELDDALVAQATSIAAEAESQQGVTVPSRPDLLAAVLEKFEALYSNLSTDGGRADVVARATARSEVLGRVVIVRFADGSTIEGTAKELTSSGALAIETGGGATTIVGMGEIEQLRPS